MIYSNYFWGMNSIWWFIWVILLFWIFVMPYSIPGQRYKQDSPLDILRKKYAAGEFSDASYQERKKILEEELVRLSR